MYVSLHEHPLKLHSFWDDSSHQLKRDFFLLNGGVETEVSGMTVVIISNEIFSAKWWDREGRKGSGNCLRTSKKNLA